MRPWSTHVWPRWPATFYTQKKSSPFGGNRPVDLQPQARARALQRSLSREDPWETVDHCLVVHVNVCRARCHRHQVEENRSLRTLGVLDQPVYADLEVRAVIETIKILGTRPRLERVCAELVTRAIPSRVHPAPAQ